MKRQYTGWVTALTVDASTGEECRPTGGSRRDVFAGYTLGCVPRLEREDGQPAVGASLGGHLCLGTSIALMGGVRRAVRTYLIAKNGICSWRSFSALLLIAAACEHLFIIIIVYIY